MQRRNATRTAEKALSSAPASSTYTSSDWCCLSRTQLFLVKGTRSTYRGGYCKRVYEAEGHFWKVTSYTSIQRSLGGTTASLITSAQALVKVNGPANSTLNGSEI